jgi:hypothetical protein
MSNVIDDVSDLVRSSRSLDLPPVAILLSQDGAVGAVLIPEPSERFLEGRFEGSAVGNVLNDLSELCQANFIALLQPSKADFDELVNGGNDYVTVSDKDGVRVIQFAPIRH